MVFYWPFVIDCLLGMDRDYGPGSYGGLAFKDIYLKILLLSATKGEHHLIFFLFKLFIGMDRDYGHGSYGGQRSMDSYLNQSYGMDNHSGGGGGSR